MIIEEVEFLETRRCPVLLSEQQRWLQVEVGVLKL